MPDHTRAVLLRGAYNVRDMGGLATADGRFMRRGLIYRAAELSALTAADSRKLRGLDLRLICDLRLPAEFASKPARVPDGRRTRIVNVPIHHDGESMSSLKFMLSLVRESGAADPAISLKEFYLYMAFRCGEQIRRVIQLLSDRDGLPALVHCTAGKDRTGFVSAILQLLAGVPLETVMEDYLSTNDYYAPRLKSMMRFVRWMSLFRVRSAAIRAMLEARREYLQAALDAIFARYDSIEEYLGRACGVDAGRLRHLRRTLVVPA